MLSQAQLLFDRNAIKYGTNVGNIKKLKKVGNLL